MWSACSSGLLVFLLLNENHLHEKTLFLNSHPLLQSACSNSDSFYASSSPMNLHLPPFTFLTSSVESSWAPLLHLHFLKLIFLYSIFIFVGLLNLTKSSSQKVVSNLSQSIFVFISYSFDLSYLPRSPLPLLESPSLFLADVISGSLSFQFSKYFFHFHCPSNYHLEQLDCQCFSTVLFSWSLP